MVSCGEARCKVYKFVETGSAFIGNVEKQSFHINHSFDCDSRSRSRILNNMWGARQHHSG